MKVLEGGRFYVTRARFKKVIKKFQKNNKRNYDFLVRAGDKFKEDEAGIDILEEENDENKARE